MKKVTPENYKEFAGYKACRKSRSTGSIISVVDGVEQDFDTEGGRWYTICEDHGTTISHGSLTLATSHAAAPEGWCEGCQEIWDKKQKELHKHVEEITRFKRRDAR